ncbi:hypothetical protein EJ02DRAFT_493401 [Clathrospora elynae]|uniref:Uncharacterized protein n=1 Tax=Clathrospora elynae TaxID=706981 RepID=A0A6A5SK56_9PLEO|nr:hypothetical protein EJ02DRAFT_493401 [Clathrospora elynae]
MFSTASSPPRSSLTRPNNAKALWPMPTASVSLLKPLYQQLFPYGIAWWDVLKDLQELDAKPLHIQASNPPKEAAQEQTPVTVTLIGANVGKNGIRNSPSLTLTSTPSSPPTMNMETWKTLGTRVWPQDVHVTLRHYEKTTQPRRKWMHKSVCRCSPCDRHAKKKMESIKRYSEIKKVRMDSAVKSMSGIELRRAMNNMKSMRGLNREDSPQMCRFRELQEANQ